MEYLIRTKIIATIGPACEEKIPELIKAGAKIFRLNSSHGTKDEHKRNIEKIREAAAELKEYIPVMLDLQGPKIRIGNLKEPINLEDDSRVTLKHCMESDNSDIIPVDYSGIVKDVKKGDVILLDDGKMELEVTGKSEFDITAKVVRGGILASRKGLNIPGNTTSITAITQRDIDYIKFSVENDIDYIALSFVRKKEDIECAKDYIREFNGDIPVIAKIEKPQALDNLDSIIDVSDSVMVARGDLGIEISPEKVPIAQKQIIKQANTSRKNVIIATQMLESMINQPMPTRAEASDVANAILDGTDAVTLSGETAMGKYPVETVNMMSMIAKNVETSSLYANNQGYSKADGIYEADSHAIATAVIRMLDDIEIDAIVAFTKSGFTGRLLSKAKPSVPIIAISDDERICRRLNLYWGVFPHLMNFEMSLTEEFLEKIDDMLINKTFLKTGDKIIVTGGLPYLAKGKTNFLRLHQIGLI